MTTRNILFSAAMVKAILARTKTQTRRVVKCPPLTTAIELVENAETFPNGLYTGWVIQCDAPLRLPLRCPYGVPGDILRVKENAWMWCEKRPNGVTKRGQQKFNYVPMREAPIHYCANTAHKPYGRIVSPETGNEWLWRKKIARFLPGWAVRIELELKAVRVERARDISEADAMAEGIEMAADGTFWARVQDFIGQETAVSAFSELWDSINAAGGNGWVINRFVWVLEFVFK